MTVDDDACPIPSDAAPSVPAPSDSAPSGTHPSGSAPCVPSAVVWSPELTAYDFGPYHPMSPVRLTLTHTLARAGGLLDRPGVQIIAPPVASDAQLEAVHDPAYVQAVRRASTPEALSAVDELISYGIGGEDVPAFPGMHEASARLAGGAIAAIDAIASGQVRRAVHIAGGMHHARPASASGFCVYNDAAVAIRHLLQRDPSARVLYIDVDVHHGDGVEIALWDEPRAITLSVHETGEKLFPGTGFVQDTGGPGALGSAINVPLPPRTTADGWVRALGATIPALVRAIRPTLIVSQHGADTHRMDPLADFSVSLEAQCAAMEMIRDAADEVCEGRWLALGGGGYAVIDVVPRSWAQLIAVVTGEAIPAETPLPAAYQEAEAQARKEHGIVPEPAIRAWGDGRPLTVRPWEDGFDPEDDLDRAVQAARRVAFPEWGLDPFLD